MATVKWVVDPTHSEVQFKVKHLMITTITVYFKNFNIEALTPDENFTDIESLIFTADVN